MSAWLTIIGVGDDGLDGLPESSLLLLRHAQLIIAQNRTSEPG